MRHSNTLLLNADAQPMNIFLQSKAVPWQEAIQKVWSGDAAVLHEYEDWEVHSPKLTMKVPSVIILTDYKNVKRYAPFSKENVKLWYNYECQYCGCKFPSAMLTFDHVTPASKGGGTTWENIVAACSPCNNKRGNNTNVRPMREPRRPSYWELLEVRKKYPFWIPHESWKDYLDWPEDMLKIPSKKPSNVIQLPLTKAA